MFETESRILVSQVGAGAMQTDGEPEFPLIAACAIPLDGLQLIAQLSSVVAQTKVSLEGISFPILGYSLSKVWNSLHLHAY